MCVIFYSIARVDAMGIDTDKETSSLFQTVNICQVLCRVALLHDHIYFMPLLRLPSVKLASRRVTPPFNTFLFILLDSKSKECLKEQSSKVSQSPS